MTDKNRAAKTVLRKYQQYHLSVSHADDGTDGLVATVGRDGLLVIRADGENQTSVITKLKEKFGGTFPKAARFRDGAVASYWMFRSRSGTSATTRKLLAGVQLLADGTTVPVPLSLQCPTDGSVKGLHWVRGRTPEDVGVAELPETLVAALLRRGVFATGADESESDAYASVGPILDPARLRLGQDFGTTVGVRKLLLTVPVRKPNRQDFIRVHPSEEYRLHTTLLEAKEAREVYVVDRPLWQNLSHEVTPKMLFTSINRQGTLFLWPVKLAGPDGRIDEWNRTALVAAEAGMERWVRVASNTSLGAYDLLEATGQHPEPEWPEITFTELLRVAFKGRFITDMDHPVLRALRGEV